MSRIDWLGGVQIKIVGHEAVVGAGQLGLLDDRVAAFENFQQLGGVVKLRAAVVAQRGKMGEGEQHVDFSQGQRALADAARFGGDGQAQLGEQAALDFDDLLLGVEDLGFVFLQLRGGEALGARPGSACARSRRERVAGWTC